MKYIATTNSKLDYGRFIVGSAVIEPQNNFKCGGYSALAGTVSVTLYNITDPENPGTCLTATVLINGTAKAKAYGSKCLLEGDSGSVMATFIGKPTERLITVTIKDAGQKEVKSI